MQRVEPKMLTPDYMFMLRINRFILRINFCVGVNNTAQAPSIRGESLRSCHATATQTTGVGSKPHKNTHKKPYPKPATKPSRGCARSHIPGYFVFDSWWRERSSTSDQGAPSVNECKLTVRSAHRKGKGSYAASTPKFSLLLNFEVHAAVNICAFWIRFDAVVA
jgi:hypothetical protein